MLPASLQRAWVENKSPLGDAALNEAQPRSQALEGTDCPRRLGTRSLAKTVPSWGCFRVASAVCLGFLMGASGRARVQVFTGDRTFHSASLRCSWFSRALLGRSEPYEAYRKPRLLVVRFRSPRADPRGMNAIRCAKSVRMPRGSDDASSLENGAIMGLATSASSERRGSLWTFANQTHSASLRACFMAAPFFASERVPRRRGHSFRSSVCIRR